MQWTILVIFDYVLDQKPRKIGFLWQGWKSLAKKTNKESSIKIKRACWRPMAALRLLRARLVLAVHYGNDWGVDTDCQHPVTEAHPGFIFSFECSLSNCKWYENYTLVQHK